MIPVHDIRTVDHQGWKGFKNGILLKVAEDAGFQVLLTYDQGIEYQQNLSGRNIAVVRLSSKNRELIAAHAQKIAEAIETAQPGTVTFVDIGRFKGKEQTLSRE